MIAIVVLGLWLMMTLAPETPIARWLRTWAVDRPAAWLSRVRRGQVALLLVFSAAVAGALWLGGDAIRAFATGVPDLAAWAVTFDIATFADMAIAVALASTAQRWRGSVARMVAVVRRPGICHRRARKGPRVPHPAPANDDEDASRRIAA